MDVASPLTTPESSVYEEGFEDSYSPPLKSDGRPIWEPPILDYSELLDEEYEKKREAALKYTNGNVGKATKIMDTDNRTSVVMVVLRWARDNRDDAEDATSRGSFWGLAGQVEHD